MTRIFKVFLILIPSVLVMGCKYSQKETSYDHVYPHYHTQYADMQSVNSKNNVITTVVKDTTNTDFRIDHLSKNTISVIKLWATWCSPCIESMPEFQSLKEEYQSHKNIRFFTVAIDDSFEHWKRMIAKRDWKVDHYWAEHNEKSQIYQLSYELSDSLVVVTLPNYIILGESGKLKENIVTNGQTKKYLKEVVKKLAK